MDCAGAGDWDRTSDLRFTNYFPTSRNLATPHRLREGRDAPTATACHVSATSQPRRSLNSLHDGATPPESPPVGLFKGRKVLRHASFKFESSSNYPRDGPASGELPATGGLQTGCIPQATLMYL